MSLGKDIKQIRQQKGMTQAQLAAAVGTTTQNISQYERGVRNPKIGMIQRMAAALNVSLDALDPVAAARKELTDSLFSMVSADKESGKSWTISDWVKNRDEQVKAGKKIGRASCRERV